jgi:IS5 family transposase
MTTVRELADYVSGAAIIADTGYGSNELRVELRARGINAVIHSKPERKRALPLDRTRYLIEVCFHELEMSGKNDSEPVSVSEIDIQELADRERFRGNRDLPRQSRVAPKAGFAALPFTHARSAPRTR